MHIEKRGYSSNPWRLVTSTGAEVTTSQNFKHPDLGNTRITQSVSGATKKECTANALALLESYILRNTP